MNVLEPRKARAWHGSCTHDGCDAAQDTVIDIRRTVIWVILLGAGGLLVSCDQSPLVPFSPSSWNDIRYHEYSDGGSVDLVLSQTGGVVFSDDRSEEKVMRTGLLSEETTRELDLLAAGIEPVETRADAPCPVGIRYFASVTKDGSILSFAGSACEPLPAGQAALVETLQRFVLELVEERIVPIDFIHLGDGRGDLKPGARIVTGEDDLAGLLVEISSNQPVVWRSVDFRTEMVLGVVGMSDLQGIRITGVAMTERGQIRLLVDDFVGVAGCPSQPGRPYHFIRFPKIVGDLLIERQVVEVPCDS